MAGAALNLLRQPFYPVLREANGFRGSRYSWYALPILDASAQRPKSCHYVERRDCKPRSPGQLKSLLPTNKVDLPIVPCFEGSKLATGL